MKKHLVSAFLAGTLTASALLSGCSTAQAPAASAEVQNTEAESTTAQDSESAGEAKPKLPKPPNISFSLSATV